MELEGVAVKNSKINTELNILDLPDEILIDIFNHLPLLDLSSTCQTCKRFQAVSVYTFSKNRVKVFLERTGFYNISSRDDIDFNEERCDLNKLTAILQCFGNSIDSLSLGCHRVPYFYVTPLLHLVNTYATEKLTHLCFTCVVDIDIDQMNDFAQLFGRLEKLELELSFYNNANLRELLTRCECLKELSLQVLTSIDKSTLFSINPKIEKFIYRGVRELNSYMSFETLYKFLKTYSNLRSIQIECMSLPKTKHVKNLENLNTLLVHASCAKYFNTMDWIELFQLKSLKQLKLITTEKGSTNVFSKIESKPPTDIESFWMEPYELEDWYNVLNAFTFRNLKKLVFFALGIDLLIVENQVRELAKNSVNVDEFRFQCFDDTLMLAIYFIKYFKGLKILVLDKFDYITAEDLIQMADAQSNKNDKLIVKCDRGLDKTAKQALKENPGKFSMLNIIECGQSEFYLYSF